MKIIKRFKGFFRDDIVRRVFIKNAFDGVITVLGILIALFLAGVRNNDIVIASCLGSGIAMGVSGIWGAYLTESAERKLRLKRIEKHLLKELGNTRLGRQSKNASIIVALFDGFSPLAATILIIMPFFLPIISITYAYSLSFIVSFFIIVFLGIMISRVGKEKFMPNILKMIGASIILLIILFLVELVKNLN